MNIALIGYGLMGKEIEKIAIERGHSVVLVVDESNVEELNSANLAAKKIDIAIDFSTMQTAYHGVKTCLEAGVAVVSGTTGWADQMDSAKKLCEERGGTFFYAPNFSVGVNIMFEMNRTLARLMNPLAQYDVTLEEVHHTQKKDAPGGSAISLAEDIVKHLDRKEKWVNQTTTRPEELELLAVRRGSVIGTHTVTYESEVDSITVVHNAKNRRGFAMGAVLAAEFIRGKKGLFSMTDLLNLGAK